MRPLRFLAMLRRRLRLPLPAVPGTCRCGAEQDPLGDHRAACAPSGLLKLRAGPVEKAWGQVCEEAGAQVLENQFLRDMGLETEVRRTDDRRVELVVKGLPLFHGIPLARFDASVSPHSTRTAPPGPTPTPPKG